MELWANGSGSEPSSLSRIRLQISTAYLFRSSITAAKMSISLLEECVHEHKPLIDLSVVSCCALVFTSDELACSRLSVEYINREQRT